MEHSVLLLGPALEAHWQVDLSRQLPSPGKMWAIDITAQSQIHSLLIQFLAINILSRRQQFWVPDDDTAGEQGSHLGGEIPG